METSADTQNNPLLESSEKQLELSRTLQQMGALLTSRLNLDQLLDELFDLLARLVDYDCVSVQLVDDEGEMYMVAGRGFTNMEEARELVSGGRLKTLKKMPRLDAAVIIPDTLADPHWVHEPAVANIRCWIGAPLLVKEQLIGILNVDSQTPRAFDASDVETVVAFANQAAAAIENVRLYDEVRRRAKELEILHEVALATATMSTVDELLQRTSEMISASLYPDIFGFVMVDSKTGQLVPHPSYQGIPEEAFSLSIPYDQSVAGYVAQTGRPFLSPDISQEDRYFEVSAQTRSEVAVPLIVKQRVIGVINVESPEEGHFNKADVHFLTTLASQVAGAIERTQLYESLQQYTAHLAQEVNRRTAELRAERDRTQAVLDSAGEGIFFTDRNGVILYINLAMSRLTGCSVKETLGQTPRLWQHIPDAPGMRDPHEQMWEAIRMGRDWSGELIHRRKDGSLFDASLTISPIHNPMGELTGFVGVQSDISRLKEVDRLKSRFVSNVSHELRTPLTNIKTYITLLERGRPDRYERYLNVLHNETERLARLIQDLLDLSRLETETAPLQLKPTRLKPVVQEAVELFATKAEQQQIKLSLKLPADLPATLAVPIQLEQVLSNLIGNALVYSPAGSEVVVSAGSGQDQGQPMVWIRVADNGPGIPEEEIDRLYERFFRGQLAVDRNVPGTGLGLAICKEIVQRHNGRIEVKSEIGKGTSFTVWLMAAASR